MKSALQELRRGAGTRPGWNFRSQVLTIGVVSAVGIAVLISWPSRAEAGTFSLEETKRAMQNVDAIYATARSTTGSVIERWQKGVMQRTSIANKIDRSFDGRYVWTYDVQRARLEKSSGLPDGFGFPLGPASEFAKALEAGGAKPKLQTSIKTVDGKKRTLAIFEWSEDQADFRAELICDTKTSLPYTLQFQTRKNNAGWRRGATYRYQYPDDIPDSFFTLKPRPGDTFVDQTAGKPYREVKLPTVQAPFPGSAGLTYGVPYAYIGPFGGSTKGKTERAFAGSAFIFHPDGTVDYWVKLGPITNVYWLSGRQLELALHGWKSDKDIPKEWPGTRIELMPGDWMPLRLRANATVSGEYVTIDSNSGATKYTSIITSISTSKRILIDKPNGRLVTFEIGTDRLEHALSKSLSLVQK